MLLPVFLPATFLSTMSRSTQNTEPEVMTVPTVHVAAGVLVDSQGNVLLARRAADSHQGGLWEFPGGKLESGEQVQQALFRELQEELGIQVREARPLIRVPHRYADRTVILDTWRVTEWDNQPEGREGQPLVWVPSGQLPNWPMPAADRPILRALSLPDRYLITPPVCENQTGFLLQLRQALETGISLVQFRVFGLRKTQLENLAIKARMLCDEYDARMLLNGPVELARKTGAHGLHLDRRRLSVLNDRREYEGLLLAASCHDAGELRLAQSAGVDFAVLSPVLPTRSHPDAEALGWEGFGELCRDISIPVYALGGMTPDLLEQSWRQGAQGIAAIRGLWPSF